MNSSKVSNGHNCGSLGTASIPNNSCGASNACNSGGASNVHNLWGASNAFNSGAASIVGNSGGASIAKGSSTSIGSSSDSICVRAGIWFL